MSKIKQSPIRLSDAIRNISNGHSIHVVKTNENSALPKHIFSIYSDGPDLMYRNGGSRKLRKMMKSVGKYLFIDAEAIKVVFGKITDKTMKLAGSPFDFADISRSRDGEFSRIDVISLPQKMCEPCSGLKIKVAGYIMTNYYNVCPWYSMTPFSKPVDFVTVEGKEVTSHIVFDRYTSIESVKEVILEAKRFSKYVIVYARHNIKTQHVWDMVECGAGVTLINGKTLSVLVDPEEHDEHSLQASDFGYGEWFPIHSLISGSLSALPTRMQMIEDIMRFIDNEEDVRKMLHTMLLARIMIFPTLPVDERPSYIVTPRKTIVEMIEGKSKVRDESQI